ncbi:MAG: phosphate/phosphite/phosphonate ABC transporter substrate-binding protein [Planctomycetes bacterium]|jgi:phosphonate transport system substrate-binding protein|nr:phosphate/phosphite/phosphonate ABC transporter substrate-binding protein [Planctomycetota bacterium]MCL4728841.1 phosphate/phosphite/phosphonate ABC transporter substrate-binding protein [Planctomycetota bacterium]
MLKRTFASLKFLLAMGAVFAASTVSVAEEGARHSGPQPMQAKAAEIKEIRITSIPDSDAKKIEENCNLIADRLTKVLGIPVKFMPQQDYAACVTGMATDQLELVWYGGVTCVQAMKKMDEAKKGCTLIACRDADLKYKSYFIANKEAKIGPVKDLKELAAKAEGLNFTFGSKSSTSGHVMPRHFFQDQTGEKPEDVFKNVAYSGNHDNTLKNVAAGTAHVGAMNYKNWDNAKDDLAKAKEKCELIYTTPFYADYVWMANDRIGAENIKKIKDFFLGLDSKNPEDQKILAAWGIKDGKYVECEKSMWDGIKKILEAGVDVG